MKKTIITLVFITLPIFSFAASPTVPSTKSEVMNLLLFKNSDKMIETPGETKVSIGNWYLKNTLNEENEDLNENGVLYNRLLEANCKENNNNQVQCKVLLISQEYVQRTDNSENFCQGADYGEGISITFDKVDSKLAFNSGKIDVSMSGDGPCGAEWE